MSRDNNAGSNLVFFLLGAAVGAAVALLYAPQEGEATRRLIGEKAGEVRDKATEVTGTVSQTAKDKWGVVTTAVTDKGQELLSKGQELLSRSKDAANQATDDVAERVHAGVNSIPEA
jgi:gas vesicle protein